MAALPIGKDHDSWPLLAYDSRDLQPVLPGVFHAAIRNIERLPKADLQDLGGFGGFAGPVFGGAAGAHLSLGEVEDSGAVPLLRHLEQGAAAGLLYVITMRGNRQNVQ